jgi:pimeloyl-ACP methyl ester carboxylesterase
MSVQTADGLVLKGALEYPETGAPRDFPLAVLAHQYPSTADSFAPLVEDLLDLGLACLSFDQRGHGSSIMGPGGPVVIDAPVGFGADDFGRAFVSSISKVGFDRIDNDILRVASWGVAQNFIDPGKILLIGGSIGGSGVLLAAPAVPGLAGVITLGAAGAPAFGSDTPQRIRRNLQGLKVKSLLLSSEQDPFAGAENVQVWGADLPAVASRIVPGKAHAMGIYYEVREDILTFVRSILSLD